MTHETVEPVHFPRVARLTPIRESFARLIDRARLFFANAYATALTQALLFSACGTVQAASGSLDETDQFALSQIASACGENATQSQDEFTTFFQGFLLSEAARRQHSTQEIHTTFYSGGTMLSDTVVSPETYSGFSVQMVDYAYKPVEPAKAGDKDEYLDLQFN